MAKKVTTLNIDEFVLKKAKREIPNLSIFIEDCLKVYLGIGDDNFCLNIQDNLNTIKQARLNIHLASKSEFKQEEIKGYDDKKLDDAWVKIWSIYRNTEAIHMGALTEAEKVLGNTFDLQDMMQTLLLYLPKHELSKCDSWGFAVKEYEDILNGVSDYV